MFVYYFERLSQCPKSKTVGYRTRFAVNALAVVTVGGHSVCVAFLANIFIAFHTLFYLIISFAFTADSFFFFFYNFCDGVNPVVDKEHFCDETPPIDFCGEGGVVVGGHVVAVVAVRC